MSGAIQLKDAAYFADLSDQAGLKAALSVVESSNHVVVISDNSTFLDGCLVTGPVMFADIGLDGDLLDSHSVYTSLRDRLGSDPSKTTLIVDMTWCIDSLDAENALENWSVAVEQLCEMHACSVISVYNYNLLLETQMQVALRRHLQFLAPSGVYENPFWLPSRLRLSGLPTSNLRSYWAVSCQIMLGYKFLIQMIADMRAGPAQCGWITVSTLNFRIAHRNGGKSDALGVSGCTKVGSWSNGQHRVERHTRRAHCFAISFKVAKRAFRRIVLVS